MTSRRIGLCAALGFVVVWLLGFASSLAAHRCLDGQRSSQSRVTACSFAAATTLSRFGEGDAPEYVRISFEHGIVLSEVGRTDAALTAMRKAMARAGLDQRALASDPSALVTRAGRVLLERAQRLDIDSAAFTTFARAMNEG